MSDFWDKLGDTFIEVGKVAGTNAANLIGNSSPATTTTTDTDTYNNYNISLPIAVLTVGAVVGGILLIALVVK